MTPTMPSTHPCPDLAELAAFVDGRLAGEARAAVIEHLASCEDCYEVYAETLRVGEDLAAEDAAANDDLAPVVRHPRSFRWVWPAAAAALAATVGFLVLRLPVFLAAPRSSGELVAATGITEQTELKEDWDAHRWSTTRGQNPYELLSPEERSFRVGVRVVDLRSALELSDRDVVRAVTGEIVTLLEADEFGFGEILYESLEREFGPDAPSAKLIQLSEQAEKDMLPEDETYFELGKQIEAARLAALAGNVDYFKSGRIRRFLRGIPKMEIAEADLRPLTELKALVEAGTDAEGLVKELEAIIAMRKPSA
ncbi:MAG TPA: zf-HC2 domain-containing protein [Thermoanaerobaculia bacterium]